MQINARSHPRSLYIYKELGTFGHTARGAKYPVRCYQIIAEEDGITRWPAKPHSVETNVEKMTMQHLSLFPHVI